MEQKNKGYLYRKDYKPDLTRIPLGEYPRPHLKRDSYLSLNGAYAFAVSKEEDVRDYPEQILVPYAPESPESGINRLIEPDEYLFYKKNVVLPEGFVKEGTRLLLHFGGVDQICDIWIDGKPVFHHEGGYTPFEIPLDPPVKSSFELKIRVKDVTDQSYFLRGKQTLSPNGWFYSSSSGIYKSVWLEAVPDNYIRDVVYRPDYDRKSVRVYVETEKPCRVSFSVHGIQKEFESNSWETIDLKDDFRPWSDKDPYLYEGVKIRTENDAVSSFFAVRKIEIRKGDDGKKHLYLNGKKIFLLGLLDQGYYYLGNLTPLSYQDYEDDIWRAKEAHYNCLRVHIAYEEEVFYYLASKAGIFLIQDFVNGGESYSLFWTIAPRILTFMKEPFLKDSHMHRTEQKGKDEYFESVRVNKKVFDHYPCVLIYTLFNEGWGEFSPSKIYHAMKKEDPDHLFDTASGWYDADSDFFSIHTYTFINLPRKDKKDRAYIISECGGIGWKDPDHSEFEDFFGHQKAKRAEEVKKKYKKVLAQCASQIEKRGLNGIIYTQLADCEHEYNGIWTFDRKVQKVGNSFLVPLHDEIIARGEKEEPLSEKEERK